jgi:hypothetical protein
MSKIRLKGTVTFNFDYETDPGDYGSASHDLEEMVRIDLKADELGFIADLTAGDPSIHVDEESS